MYIVSSEYTEYEGEESVSISKENGVYHHKWHSPPQEGETLRIEEDLRHNHKYNVAKILEQSETVVIFEDEYHHQYRWEKVEE